LSELYCPRRTPEGTRNTKDSLGLALASGAHPRRI